MMQVFFDLNRPDLKQIQSQLKIFLDLLIEYIKI